MNKFCNLTGVGLIPWGPLATGQLARPLEGTEDTKRAKFQNQNAAMTNSIRLSFGITETDAKIIRRVEELAERKGWKMSQVAIAWLAKRVTSPIIGFSSVKRLEEAVEARGKVLSAEEEKYLEEVYVDKPISGHV